MSRSAARQFDLELCHLPSPPDPVQIATSLAQSLRIGG